MASTSQVEAKEELESLRDLVSGLEEAIDKLEGIEAESYSDELAEEAESWLLEAEEAYKSDNFDKVISISDEIRKAADKVRKRAEKRKEKMERAARVLKDTIGSAFQKLREIKADEAEDYAPELVREAERRMIKMKKALDRKDYRTLLEEAREISQLGDNIKQKIYRETDGDMKTKADKAELSSEGGGAPEIKIEKGIFETPGIEAEIGEIEEMKGGPLKTEGGIGGGEGGGGSVEGGGGGLEEKAGEFDQEIESEVPEPVAEEEDSKFLSDLEEDEDIEEEEEIEPVESPQEEFIPEVEEEKGEPQSYLDVQRLWNPADGLGKLRRLVDEYGVEVKEVEIPGLEPFHPLKDGPISIFEGKSQFDEVERYWIEEPFNFTVILRNEKTGEFRYHLVEPVLTEEEKELLSKVWTGLRDVLPYEEIEEGEKENVLEEKFAEVVKNHGIKEPRTAYKLLYFIKRDNLGLNKLNPLLKDQDIEDISCDGKNVPIYLYHRKYYNIRTNVKFGDELDSFVAQLAEKSGSHLSYGEPVAESSLPDGSRVQATFGTEVTTRGSSFSIRRFMGSTFTPVDLIKYGTFSPQMLAYLWLTSEHGKNTMIIGGTASGKTSTLNALGFFIPPDAKIVSIEDTRELSLYQENWLPNVTREEVGAKEIDMHELVKIAMRQRPEILIVGEVRGIEARAMFQAISTGHTAFCTMHAGSVQRAANRIQGDPMNISKSMFAGLDIICLQKITNLGRKRARRNERVVEITGLDPDTRDIRIAEIYEWEKSGDIFNKREDSKHLREIQENEGLDSSEIRRELNNREKVLSYLAENDITSYGEIASTIRQYYYNSERILEEIS